jgi:hypothetical protein
MLVNNNTKRSFVVRILLLIFALLVVTGCTHNINFTSPAVPVVTPTANGKGTVIIGAIEDKRQIGMELFVFSNPPHKWIYHPEERVEDSARKLLREGFARRGFAESPDAKDGPQVIAEIMEFSGQNVPGAFYVGKCLFKIICSVSISDPRGKKTFVVRGNGENSIGRLSDDNMRQLLTQTYEDFLGKLDLELEKAGY